MNTIKAEITSLLDKLPDDCTFEDVQYHLYVLEKVQRGLEVADTQGALTQAQVESRLGQWLAK